MKFLFESVITATICFHITSAYISSSKTFGPSWSNPIQITKRQLPADPVGVQTIISPSGVNITYKEPGKDGVCETTPGVNSYAGFVNLAPDVHSFFWWFDSRNDPVNDPVTFWLNGGPGSDSLIGLFQELGPCNVTEELVTQLNPYAWNNVSNMLFLSQPLGVGFSYASKEAGSLSSAYNNFLNASQAPVTGRYPVINATAIDTTDLAAIAAWEVIQGFYSALPQFNSSTSKVFNLATESYGGHYGPAFFNYFYEQNEMIANGSADGVQLDFNSLTIINGIIDEFIQIPYYPEFAVNNTYDIPTYNESVYQYTQFALYSPMFGCLVQIENCYAANQSTIVGDALCAEASNMCRDNVESPYYAYGGRGIYDIRHPYKDPTPPQYFVQYLNQSKIQEALGVDTNYTTSNAEVSYAFQQTGDQVYRNFLEDLEMILDSGVRVSLIYGDADYICNWYGGEAVSLLANYSNTGQFNAAGYTPMIVDGVEYGATREYGNFSFTRVYEAGHEVPYYQPIAALALFNRTINGYDSATGTKKVTADLSSEGDAQATHTNSFVPLPSTSTNSRAASGDKPARKPIPKRKVNVNVNANKKGPLKRGVRERKFVNPLIAIGDRRGW